MDRYGSDSVAASALSGDETSTTLRATLRIDRATPALHTMSLIRLSQAGNCISTASANATTDQYNWKSTGYP
jgi:hypothetical protein